MNNTLYVIAPIFNPWRYKSRIALYNNFKKYVAYSGAELITVELAHSDRPYETDADIKLRTKSELWHKERMINIGIQSLPKDWKYVAWIDADVVFARPDWAMEAVQLLHHFPVIQMFSHALDLSPKYEPMKTHEGIIYSHFEGKMVNARGKYDKYHPGFAWAATREAINHLGGLIDTAILGSADRHMALSLLEVPHSVPKRISRGYMEQLNLWDERARTHIKRDVGYLPGMLLHHWHGRKVDRRYQDRWKILVENKYDPEFDIKPDWQGLYQFVGNKPRLEQDIRRYFMARDEDNTSVV